MTELEAIAAVRRTLGQQLAQLRRNAGLTQSRLSQVVHYSRTSIASVETGRQHISDRTFWESADAAVGGEGALTSAFDALAALVDRRREEQFAAAHRRRYGSTVTIPAQLPETEDVNRRELLRLLSMAGAAVALASPDEIEGMENTGLEQSEAMNAALWQTFSLSRNKQTAMPMVRDQLDVLVEQLARPQTSAAGNRLCTQLADLFQLTGEINFDGNRYTAAAHCYSLAASAARETKAWDLWACALVRHAFVHLYEQQFSKAEPMLATAGQVADQGDRQLSTRYWVAAVHAQAFAGLGDLDGARRAFDQAEQVSQLSGQVQNSGWLRFDDSRLPEERGAAYVTLRQPELAAPALSMALRQPMSARRRGAILADLAVVGAQRGDAEEVLAYARQALDVAGSTHSGYVVRKLQPLPHHLGSLRNDARIDTLTRELAN